MVKGRTRKFLISGVFVVILMAIFGSKMSFGATNLNMVVISELSIDFPSIIVIDASPNYTGIQTANATLRVNTNSDTGYVAIFSVDGTKAANDTSGRLTDLKNYSEGATIPTLTSPQTKANFPVGHWGYSLDGGENYRGITTYEDTNRLVIDSNQVGSDGVTNFTFGVKINDSQPAGMYSNTLLITAVADMQDVPEPAVVAPKALLGSNNHLMFVYDDKTYRAGDVFSGAYGGDTVLQSIYDVYNGPNWRSSSITAIDFEESFVNYQPTSTYAWFSSMSGLKDVNGIENFDTSMVTNMSYMFENSFNADYPVGISELSKMDVGNVQTFEGMFQNAASSTTHGDFILDVSDWDTSSATNMAWMFYNFGKSITSNGHYEGGNYVYETAEIKGIENFKTGNVTSMYAMFYFVFNSCEGSCRVGSMDLTDWDVSNVTTMGYMFDRMLHNSYSSIEIDLTGWDVRKVTSMEQMFNGVLGGANGGHFSIVANGLKFDSLAQNGLNSVFQSAGSSSFTANIAGWDLSGVGSDGAPGGSLFYNDYGRLKTWVVDASNWVFKRGSGSFDSLYRFFWRSGMYASETWSLDVSGWNTSGITNFGSVFSGNGNGGNWFLDVTGWDTSSATNMADLFNYSATGAANIEIVGIEYWNTGNVTNMNQVFRKFGAQSRKGAVFETVLAGSDNTAVYSLDNWTINNVTDLGYGFQGAVINAQVANNLKNWNTSSLSSTSFKYLFRGSRVMGDLDLRNWDTSSATDMSYMFGGSQINGTLNVTGWDTSHVTNMKQMFGFHRDDTLYDDNSRTYDTATPATIKELVGIEGFNTSSLTNANYMFAGIMLDHFDFDLSGWQTSNLSNVTKMFAWARTASSSTDCSLDVSGWNLSSVSSTNGMFMALCSDIQYDNYYQGGFGDLYLNMTGWTNTTNITNTSSMFYGFGGFGFDNVVGWQNNAPPRQWNASPDYGDIPSGYYSDVTIEGLNTFDTSNVTNMSYMFYGYGMRDPDLELTLSLNTGKVTNMSYMFQYAGSYSSSVNIDINSLDTGKVTNMSYMFYFVGPKADSVIISLEDINTSSVTNMDYMFYERTGQFASTFIVNPRNWTVTNVTSHTNFAYRDIAEPSWSY